MSPTPKQLHLPTVTDSKVEVDFDSPYLSARVALNLLEQLDFRAPHQTIHLYPNSGLPHADQVLVRIGSSTAPALRPDKDKLMELAEGLDQRIERIGVDGRIRLTDFTLEVAGFWRY